MWAYRQLLPDLLQKLNVCARQELIPLLEIDCVKRSRAQQLFDAGYKTVGAVSRATPEELAEKVKLLGVPQARRIVASAKVRKEKEWWVCSCSVTGCLWTGLNIVLFFEVALVFCF